MDSGTGNHSKVLAATFLSAFALILTERTMRTEAASGPVVSSCAASDEGAVVKPVGRKSREPRSFDPTIHLTRLVFSESQKYEGTGRNIFGMVEDRRKKILEETKTPPPSTLTTIASAPLSLMFYGFTNMPNHPRRVFIRDEDALFIASEGDIVDRRYRIEKIESNSVELEDLIEHRSHTLMLPGQSEAK